MSKFGKISLELPDAWAQVMDLASATAGTRTRAGYLRLLLSRAPEMRAAWDSLGRPHLPPMGRGRGGNHKQAAEPEVGLWGKPVVREVETEGDTEPHDE